MDVKSTFQQEMLDFARRIESVGDQSLTIDILKVLSDHFEDDFQSAINGFPSEDE